MADESEEIEDVTAGGQFAWLKAADNVAEVARIPLLDTFALTAVEFLNLLSYVMYKNRELEKMYNKKK